MTFPSTHPALGRALVAREYSVPTDVQRAVLEANAESRDMLVSAQTGSGKTVAFGLAMAQTLLGEAERFEKGAEPLALIVAPTRELAMQVQRELAWLYAEAGARIVTCVGGMDARAESRQLGAGCHIVVGTPGRLRDHLERRRLDLSKLKTVVLDEADEMLDLGFREDLEFILDATPEERQTLLFSATMPRAIETLARRFQHEAIRIETVSRDKQHADIEYQAFRVSPGDIEKAVVNVLRFHETNATLVFCATREAVKRLHARLVERGFSAVALSGELTQNERTQALQSLRNGHARVLVATDVAARGLDLPDLTLVIHADLPNDGETLLHRSGRTGRAGKKGICTIIVPFNRRRKADMLLAAAKIKATWGPAPTAEEIRIRDQERFLANEIFTAAPTDADLELTRTLQEGRTADEIALALVRLHRSQLPSPTTLAIDAGPPRRDDRPRDGRKRLPRTYDRSSNSSDHPRGRADRPAGSGGRSPRPPREDNREMVWFRLNIGRERNADPRWLVPLICKAGDVSKAEIGSIKIHDRDTRFQIVADAADQFDHAVRVNKKSEGHISRVRETTPADDATVMKTINTLADPNVRPPNVKPRKPKTDATQSSSNETKSSLSASLKSDRKTSKTSKTSKAHWRADRPEHHADRADRKPGGRAARSAATRGDAPLRRKSRTKSAAGPDSPGPTSKRTAKKNYRPITPATK